MGGLLGIDNTWLRAKDSIGFDKLNETVTPGIYNVWGNKGLSEEDRLGIITSDMFVLEVYKNLHGVVIQEIQPYNSPQFHYRRISIDAEQQIWRPFYRFSTTEV